MSALFRVLAALLAGIWVTLSATANPPARADSAPEAIGTDTAPQIDWTQLGRSDRIDILGSDQTVDTDIPVPPGTTPGVLSGILGSIVNIIGGRVEVLDGRGTLLGVIPVPDGPASAPFTVDLGRAAVTDGLLRLTFVVREKNPPADSCTTPPSLTLSRLATTFTGQTPYPAVVADYLPGYLDEFVIRTGPTPSPAQQQAAVDLVAKLTRYYRPIPVRFRIDDSANPAPSGPPARRVIELRDGAAPGLTVISPNSADARLVISGRGDELIRQVELFSDRRVGLAQTRVAEVRAVTLDVPRSAKIKTLAQLGIAAQTSVLGTATLYLGLDLNQFAIGSIQQAVLHLVGHYTPVTGGEASVVVRSGNTVVAARRLDESGIVDITGTIPAEAMQSNVGVALELRYLPSRPCAPLNDRIQFALDPGSTIAVEPGARNRGGFPALPMAFTPDFDVVVDQPGHLRFAADAVNLLAQQTSATLRPRVTTMSAAAASARGMLVVAPGEDITRAGLDPTVAFPEADTVIVGGSPITEVDLNGAVGVIQVFTNNKRKVLAISSNGDWSLVERDFDYVRAQTPSRWAQLSGDVVATGSAGRTIALTLREGGPLINEYPGDGWKWWAQLSGAVSLVALLTAVVTLIRRRRPSRS